MQSEIQKKLDAKEAMAADLSEKQNEMAFVANYTANVQKSLRSRDNLKGETLRRKKEELRRENAAIGEEMRKTQARPDRRPSFRPSLVASRRRP